MHAIFLDRDGVISENRADHVKSWDEFRFIPGALAALRWVGEGKPTAGTDGLMPRNFHYM